MSRILNVAEHGFAILSLFFLSGAVLLLVLSGGANQEDVGVTYNTSLYRLTFVSIYIISTLLLAYRWKKALYYLTRDIFIPCFIVLAVISFLWSSEPESTIKDSINLIGSSLFGLYLATRYNVKHLVQILGWMFSISVILSFLFALGLPQYGLMGGLHTGSWRGVYMHKNGLGARMVTASTVFLILMFKHQHPKWFSFIGILLSITLVLLSKSTSSLINVVFIIFAFLILQVIRWHYRLLVLALTMLTLAAASLTLWLVNNAESLANSLGKDLTLSGRTTLWAAVWDMIQQKPWFGYGYGGFWHGLDGESAYIWLATGWRMTHPHNGFLGVWLDLGLVGLIIFLISYIQNLYRSLILARLSDDSTGFYPILSLLFLLISNLTETSLPFTSELGCSLYVFLSLVMVKELKDVKLAKASLVSSKLHYSSG